MLGVIFWGATIATSLVSENINENVSLLLISPKAPSLIEMKDDKPGPICGTMRNAPMTLIMEAGILPLQSADMLASTSTDEDEKFAFSSVNPPTYQVKVVDQTYGIKTITVVVTTHDIDTTIVMP